LDEWRSYFGKDKDRYCGYGNLGKGAELGIRQNKDMELVGIFTRRNPNSIKPLTEGVKFILWIVPGIWQIK